MPNRPANSTIVMGSITSYKRRSGKGSSSDDDRACERYREPLTAPFGLEAPEEEHDTQPEIPAPQVQGETARRRLYGAASSRDHGRVRSQGADLDSRASHGRRR